MHFRRLLSTLCAAVSVLTARAEQVVISEIMYQPPANKPEFIELSNLTATPLDMALWKFTDGVGYTFPNFSAGTPQAHFLQPFERIIVSSATPAATRAAYPSIPANVRVLGPWTSGTLANEGELITLRDKNDVIVCKVEYGDSGEWPIAPDGTGHSLVLADENKTIDDFRVWRASTQNGGSPGVADPAMPATGITLNEVHFGATGKVDWIEVRNDSRTTTVAASAFFVASKNDFSDKVPLSGNLTPGAVASVNVDFAANGDGEVKLYVVDSSNNARDAIKITRKAGRDCWQELPAGSGHWYNGTQDTRDAQNDPARNTSIVINELMADPPSNQRDAEFIELYNRGAEPVDMSGWKLKEGVDFTFPAGTTLQPGGYLVVGANAAWLNANYTGLNAIGNWDGQLSNSGEVVKLDDANGNLVNQVDYRFTGEWPELAAGNGSSLELVNPNTDNSIGSAWRDSDESQKSTFRSYTINGGTYLRTTNGGVLDDEVRVWAIGDSHIIFKDIKLRPTAGGTSVLVNSEVTTLNNNNVDGWQSRGTHAPSFHDAEGVHLLADGHGDNKCNHMEKDATGMTSNTAYTLEFQARWVHGKPRVVTQTWDTSWGGTTLVEIPLNLGTPGAANSRFNANPAPQITAMKHSPAVPTTGQTVTITAKVSTLTPLQSVQVIHRLDNINANGTWNTTVMQDNGTGGDVSANDGIYTAQISPGAFGYGGSTAIVEFYVRATASNGAITELPRKGAAMPGLWAVGTPGTTDLRRIRVVMSAYWLDALNQNSGTGGHTAKFNYKYPRLSARYFPCTFIHNDTDVYYGATCRKTGSPFTRQTDNALARGRITLPNDNPFRGKTKMYWDNDSGTSMLHNRIVRYWLYLMGVPGNENEVCRVARNGEGYTVRETNEVFDKDMLDRIWENGSDGQFFEMDDKFWIGDDGSTRLANQDGSWVYKTGDSQGAENPTAYHNQFTPKSRETEYDYSGFIEWTRQLTVNGAGMTFEQLERMADSRTMTAYAAVRGYVGDWDTITGRRGKNGYMFQRPVDNKWTFLHWDSDLAFQNSGEAVLGTITNIPTYFNRPFIRRQLNYFLTEMNMAYNANGGRLSAWLDAEENASIHYVANKSTYQAWSTNRAAAIQAYIGAAYTAAFAVSNPPSGSSQTVHTINVSGSAPSAAYKVECVGQPNAVLTWTTESNWTLTGISLKNGANALTFRMLDMLGNQVGNVINHSINKTTNAPPIPVLATEPNSRNIELGEALKVDASGSFDPEAAGPLSFSWSVTPSAGVSITNVAENKRNFVFHAPGSYAITVQVTDADAQVASTTRVFSVFNSSEFASFTSEYLPAGLTVANAELRDNYSPSTWYSLTEKPGNLVVQVLDTQPRPLTHQNGNFPLFTRPVPATENFTLQTDISLEQRPFGTFFTGLWLESEEGGIRVRYAFGLENGTTFKLFRAFNTGAFSVQVGSSTYGGGPITLRVIREPVTETSSVLKFQRVVNGDWVDVASRTVTNLVGKEGGIFVAAGSNSPVLAQNVRVAFDYFLLTNPGNSSALVQNLRVSEIMYNPPSSGAEYIELQNIGTSPLDLTGAYFEESFPWSDRFTFPNLILGPGEFCVVTNDVAKFQTIYGNSVTVAGQATGGLANDTERILLRDAAGNTVIDFAYLDSWHPQTDGNGKSLEITTTDQSLLNEAASWKPSLVNGGSVGYVDVPASISSQPSSITINPGQPISLQAGVAGSPTPTVQWLKDEFPVDGATLATYSVLSATEEDEGEYVLVAQNASGTAITETVTVSVNDPVTIDSHPSSQTVNPGGTVTFNVAVSGTGPFGYQWRKGGQNLDGKTDASLMVDAIKASEGNYDVVVTNIVGPVTSNVASLSINDPVVITTHPQSQTLELGETVTLSVEATGTGPLSYQWKRDGDDVENATGPELEFEMTEETAGTYTVVVSNAVGPVTSNEAIVNAIIAVEITEGPVASIVLNPGEPLTLSVTATGTDPITYQWFKGSTPIPNAIAATYHVAGATLNDAGNYHVVVSNDVGTVSSTIARVKVRFTAADWLTSVGTYQGLLEGANLTDPAAKPFPGRVTMLIAKTGKFTGTLEYMGLKHPLRGAFDADLNASISVTRRGLTPVALAASLNSSTKAIEVSIDDPSVTGGTDYTGEAGQIPARKPRVNPSPLAGRYTMLLHPGAGAPVDLTASSYAALSVSTKGSVTWTGKLVDGTTLRGSAWVNADGNAAFYSPLYASKAPFAGHMAGPLALTSTEANGSFYWRKPQQQRGSFWITGFDMLVDAEGWRYAAPASGARNITLTAPELSLNGPITGGSFKSPVTMTPKNTFQFPPNTQRLKFAINRTTGVVTGNYFDEAARATRKLQGVVSQELNRAGGFFQGASTAGTWELGEAQP